jgi:hypothetical protein
MADRMVKARTVVEIEWLVNVDDDYTPPSKEKFESDLEKEICEWIDATKVCFKESEIKVIEGREHEV